MAMKQNNFYLRWQKAAGAAKSETRSREMQALIPGLGVVAVAMLGWGGLTLHTSMHLNTDGRANDTTPRNPRRPADHPARGCSCAVLQPRNGLDGCASFRRLACSHGSLVKRNNHDVRRRLDGFRL